MPKQTSGENRFPLAQPKPAVGQLGPPLHQTRGLQKTLRSLRRARALARRRQSRSLVSNQRCFRRQGILSPERLKRLDRLGFSWNTRFRLNQPPGSFAKMVEQLNRHWNRRFAELVQFKREHGHFWVPRDRRWFSLNRWIIRQRKHARAGLLPAEHRARLERIGFPWQAVHPAWEQRFKELQACHKRFGHCESDGVRPVSVAGSLLIFCKARRQRKDHSLHVTSPLDFLRIEDGFTIRALTEKM